MRRGALGLGAEHPAGRDAALVGHAAYDGAVSDVFLPVANNSVPFNDEKSAAARETLTT